MTLAHAAIVASLGLTLQSAPAQAPARPRPRPRVTATSVVVRDISGAPIADARATVMGGVSKDATTDASGSTSLGTLPSGAYRLRLEREGFVTLERDVTIKAGQPSEIDIVLDAAPPPPPPPPPPTPTPAPAAGPSGPPVILSIPNFLDKNLIGRDPLKESVFGCTSDSTTRLLQIHDGLAVHTHSGLDEMIYVVAGDGTITAGAQSAPIGPGSLSIVPRGVSHGLQRRGKNPLIVLSVLAGAPCQNAAAAGK